ncbi:MAG: prolipoprotein diacylglyceryl transferase [Bacteroidetes bacterium]|nr:prolipoprotein diacylglyceryl transferase [Bacteroidota bacterium]
MNFPVYLEIGSSRILLHVILEPLAFFLGFRYFLWLKKKQGDVIPTDNRTWIIIGAIFGSLIGSRLVGGLEHPDQFYKEGNIFLHFFANKTVLGGLLGGLFGVELVKTIVKEKKASGDLFVYPILLALIIGRIGCFSMGVKEDTYGIPFNGFTGMKLGDGILRHPVALYEIGFLLLLWIVLRQLSQRVSLQNGAHFKLFMIAYFLFRFGLDFIKPHYTYVTGLSAIQMACCIGLFWYLPYIIAPRKLTAKVYA